MIIECFLIIILLCIIIYICVKGSTKENNVNRMKNIYGHQLKRCMKKDMKNGSWDENGLCNEIDGGVHQICVKNISNNIPNFSSQTWQTGWSDDRGTDNHCVCLGAWSLFTSKNNITKKNVLKCDAIPEIALSPSYISKFNSGWNKWNGYEIDNQIQNGVEQLFLQCHVKDGKPNEYFKNKYCSFAKDVDSLKTTNIYNTYCKP